MTATATHFDLAVIAEAQTQRLANAASLDGGLFESVWLRPYTTFPVKTGRSIMFVRLLDSTFAMFSRERREEVAALVSQAPIFVSRDRVLYQVAPEVVIATIAVGSVFAFNLFFLRNVENTKRRYTLAYRFTNLCLYLVLSSIGIYGELFVLPHVSTDKNLAIYQQGLQDHTYPPSIMIGFQLWALYVGTFLVDEPPHMIVHHLAVVMHSIMFNTFTNGFRYYSYLFGGLVEFSSIPLVVMNLFRENPEWRERYPLGFALSRASFAFAFLYVRVGLMFSRTVQYMVDLFVVYYTTLDKPWVFYQTYMTICVFLALFLFFLNLYWAFVIATIVLRQIYSFVDYRIKKIQ